MGTAFAPTIPLYADSLGASPLMVGLATSMSGLLGVVLRAPAGALSSVVGRRALLLSGAGVFVFAPLLLAGTAGSLPFVYVAALLYGLQNLYYPAAISLVNDVVPAEKRGTFIGYYAMWGSLGRAAAPSIAGLLISTMGFRYVFFVSAGLGAISLLLTLRLPGRGDAAVPASLASVPGRVALELREVFRERPLWLAGVARALQSLPMGAMNTYFPLYAKGVVGMDAGTIGLFSTAQVGGAILARPVTGILSTRTGRLPFMTGGMLLAAASLFSVARTTEHVPLLLACIGMGISQGICQISTIAFVSDAAGARRFGAAVGVMGAMFDLGLVSGRFVPGMALPAEGATGDDYAAAFGAVSVALIAAAALVAATLRGSPRAPDAPSESPPAPPPKGWNLGP